MIVYNRAKSKINDTISNNLKRTRIYCNQNFLPKKMVEAHTIFLRVTGVKRLMQNANDTVIHARQQMQDVTLALQFFAWLCIIVSVYDIITCGIHFGFTDAYGVHYSISSRTAWGAVDAFFYALVTMVLKEAWPRLLPPIRDTVQRVRMLVPPRREQWDIVSNKDLTDDWTDCVIVDSHPMKSHNIERPTPYKQTTYIHYEPGQLDPEYFSPE